MAKARAQNLSKSIERLLISWVQWDHYRMYDPTPFSIENCLYVGCHCLKILLRILFFGLPQKHTYKDKL